MTERDQGTVIPFALSPLRMRSGAAQRVKQGKPVEAVELLRRAAEQDDRPEGWLQLAHQLRLMQCYESAVKTLRRAIARDKVCPGMWFELAQCQLALDETDGAIDCLYHALQDDPYDDEAREMLAGLEMAGSATDAFRLSGLVNRALKAWQTGDRETALRRFRRGMKIARQKAPLHLTLALLYIAEGEYAAGMQEALRAQRLAPGDLQARLIVAAAAHEMGRQRLACGLLKGCMQAYAAPAQERMFLSVTERIGASEARQAYLQMRLRRAPWRIPLLRALADEHLLMGDIASAQTLLNTILRLDPADVKARAQAAHPEDPAGNGYPRKAVRDWLTLLMERLPGGVSPAELAEPATPIRDALDWCFAQPDGGLQDAALAGICRADSPALRAYLRERLVSPGLTENARNMMLVRMAALGDESSKAVLVGQRMAVAQATTAAKSGRQQEKFFLRMVMLDAGATGHASGMVHFAAQMWRGMNGQERCDAAGEGSYAWVKAVEIIYLRRHGLTDLEASLRADMLISPRRVQRIVRKVSKGEIT